MSNLSEYGLRGKLNAASEGINGPDHDQYIHGFDEMAYNVVGGDDDIHEPKSKAQAHHLIPKGVAKDYVEFFNELEDYQDWEYIHSSADNGVFLPNSVETAEAHALSKVTPHAAVHNGSHPAYSDFVEKRLFEIRERFKNVDINDPDAKKAAANLAANQTAIFKTPVASTTQLFLNLDTVYRD